MQTKNIFSPAQQKLIRQTDFFRLRDLIFKKTEEVFADLLDDYRIQVHAHKLPIAVQRSMGKISRGEKLEGLPWMMLDYPNCFSREGTFAIRTLFWWGNFFSITFFADGKYLEQFGKTIYSNITKLPGKKYYLGIYTDPWQHPFHKEYYTRMDTIPDLKKKVMQLGEKNKFIKISRKIKLEDANSLRQTALEAVKDYLSLLELTVD